MWTNAQRDARPAEYRWRPLFHAAKFGWRPLLECRTVTLPRRESRWNWKGCPKLANRSQPLVARSSPYYVNIWRRYRRLTSFFSDCRYMPQLRRYSPTKSPTASPFYVFSFFIILFCLVPCGRLSWLLDSFWAHVNIVHHSFIHSKLCDSAKMAIFCVLYFQRAPCSTFQTCILNLH